MKISNKNRDQNEAGCADEVVCALLFKIADSSRRVRRSEVSFLDNSKRACRLFGNLNSRLDYRDVWH